MDHTEKLELSGHKEVWLTPDDILTLKLLRDQWRPENIGWKYKPELQRALETLERILKQVG